MEARFMVVNIGTKWFVRDFDAEDAQIFIDEDTPIIVCNDLDSLSGIDYEFV